MTSAGVRMAHETSSAIEDAAEWMIGCGSRGEPEKVGLYLEKVDLTPSYVVKKAPAGEGQRRAG